MSERIQSAEDFCDAYADEFIMADAICAVRARDKAIIEAACRAVCQHHDAAGDDVNNHRDACNDIRYSEFALTLLEESK